MGLTEMDYSFAKDPEWLKKNPDKQKALEYIQSHCMPRMCAECYFCKCDFEKKGKRTYFIGFSCAIDEHKCPDEGRSDKCPLENK